MSDRRNRRRKQKGGESGSTSNLSAIKQFTQRALPPSFVPRGSACRWKWIHDHHQAVASYAALVSAIVAIFGTYIQSLQQKDSDLQIDILQKSIQQAHAHEIAPRLVVDTLEYDDFIRIEDGIVVQLRNIGKGIAHNSIARVQLLRLEGAKPEPEQVVSRRTIAPGDSVPFRFNLPAPPEKADTALAVLGTVGLYCQDDDDHEIISTQTFIIRFHNGENGQFISPQLKTPIIHRVNVRTRTPQKVRTESDVGIILDQFIALEHDNFRKVRQSRDEATRKIK